MADELALTAIIALTIILDLITGKKKLAGYFFTVAVFGLAIYAALNRKNGVLFAESYVADGISWFSKIVFLAGASLTALMSVQTLKGEERFNGAYYALLGASTLGMMILASSKELITLYIGLELATISLYALSAFYKKDPLSTEAGIKYLILGALSSGIMLYGISLIYGGARSTYLENILYYTSQGSPEPVFVIGMIFTLLGIGFKLSMVPMHMWTPDVYHGAPTPVTAFISVASKAAGFVFALRIFSYAFVNYSHIWVPVMAVLAFLTMTIGNLVAVPQKNIKRLLAYSSISQAGYILVGFVGASVIGMSSVLFYLLVYTLTNIAAFAVVAAVSNSTGSDEIDDYSGLARRNPGLALVFMLALLSLAGIPPLAGFVGKFYLFYAAMQKGYLWLVIAAALNSTISIYYYLIVLKAVYIKESKPDAVKIKIPLTISITLAITIALILAMGVYPGPVIDITTEISQKIFIK